MPHRLYFEGELLCADISGVVEERSLQAFITAIREMEGTVAATPPRLTDLSAVTKMDIRFKEISHLAELRKAVTFPNAFKSALVAAQPVQYGFARMFQTMNDHPQITIRVFTDRAEAVRWLRGEMSEAEEAEKA